jgi:hypothetical protein
MKHSPGPWIKTRQEQTVELTNLDVVRGPNGIPICYVGETNSSGLIAAAPDLLEALEQILDKAYRQNWNEGYPQQVQAAEKAIAKAKGGRK